MKRKPFTEEQTVYVLREHEAGRTAREVSLSVLANKSFRSGAFQCLQRTLHLHRMGLSPILLPTTGLYTPPSTHKLCVADCLAKYS